MSRATGSFTVALLDAHSIGRLVHRCGTSPGICAFGAALVLERALKYAFGSRETNGNAKESLYNPKVVEDFALGESRASLGLASCNLKKTNGVQHLANGEESKEAPRAPERSLTEQMRRISSHSLFALAQKMPPPPSLGELGLAKLLSFGRLGCVLALGSQACNVVLHNVFLLPRGAIRAQGRKALRSLRGVLLVEGTSFLVVVGLIMVVAYMRGLALRKRREKTGGETAASILNQALESLGTDLHNWAQRSEHLKTFSDDDIGWLIQNAPSGLRRATPDVSDDFHHRVELLRQETATARGFVQKVLWSIGLARRPKLSRAQLVNALGVPPCRGGWDGISILLVPGLLTKWYPLYFTSLRYGLERLGFDLHVSRLNTDRGVEENAKMLRKEILCIANGGDPNNEEDMLRSEWEAENNGETTPEKFKSSAKGKQRRGRIRGRRKIAIYGHSKGAVDATACFVMFPETMEHIAAFISAQGPHGGSWLANDISCTKYQKAAVAMGIERILAGSRDAVFDLSYQKRREFFQRWPQPVWTEVPTVCLATSATHQPQAMLSPVVEYMRYRYGDDLGASDGCVAMRDAVLPGAPVVWLMDMDHYGPAWNAFPAMDRYDKTHVCLALISMALEQPVARRNVFSSASTLDHDKSEDWVKLNDFFSRVNGTLPELKDGQRGGRRRRRKHPRKNGYSTKNSHPVSRDRLQKWLSGTDESDRENGCIRNGEKGQTLRVPRTMVLAEPFSDNGYSGDRLRSRSMPSFV